MKITHVFFDIGGVLGSNGWDHEQRERAASHFGLDLADLTERHQETVGTLEAGRMSLDEYLDCVVFHLRNGSIFRLGTDDAENLAAFVQTRIEEFRQQPR